MKILHIGKYYYPYHGGMESVVRDLCEGLSEGGEKVEVLCSHTKPWNQKTILNGVKVDKVFRLGTLFSQSLTPSLFFKIFFKSRKADVIHLHCPNPLAGLASLFIPKTKPLVITFHSDIIRQKTLLKFYRPLQRKILERADKILVPTINHIKYSDVLPEFEHKCEVIPFGLNTINIPSESSVEERSKSLVNEFGPYALFVGRLVGYKGLDVLVEAAKDIKGKVVIVGQGPENEKLRKKIKELDLEEKVVMRGRVEDMEEFWAYFKACSFFVLPSVSANENFGIVQLEAMYYSKAIITTNLKSGVPAVGEEGVTSLLVEPKNSKQLSIAMNSLFENLKWANEMGVEGKKRFDKYYTFQKMIDSHVNVYNDLLNPELRIERKQSFSKVS